MNDHQDFKRNADLPGEITSLLGDLPSRFVLDFVLVRCLRRCGTVFGDAWPAKPSEEFRRAVFQWMATEPGLTETPNVPVQAAARLESTARLGWDDAFLQQSADQLTARFLRLAVLAEACDQQAGAGPCGDLVRATLCAELFAFTSFNNACAQRATHSGGAPRAAEISRQTLRVIQQLPEPYRLRLNHPRRHLQAFFECLPLTAWREGQYAEPLTAAIRADAHWLSEYVRDHQMEVVDADGMLTRIAATDIGAGNEDLWPEGLPDGWPTPKPLASVGKPPRNAMSGQARRGWGRMLVRCALPLGVLAMPASLCLAAISSPSVLNTVLAACGAPGFPPGTARTFAGLILFSLLVLAVGVWKHGRLAAVVQDLGIGVLAGLLGLSFLKYRQGGVANCYEVIQYLSAPGTWNPTQLTLEASPDPTAAFHQLLPYPVPLSVLVGGVFVALGSLARAMARAIQAKASHLRRTWAGFRGELQTRLVRRFQVAAVLIAIAGVIAVLGATGVMSERRTTWIFASYAYSLLLFMSLTVGIGAVVEAAAGRVLFGVHAGPAHERIQRAMMVAFPLTFIIFPPVFGSSWVLYRYSCLNYDIFGPEQTHTQFVIGEMEQRLLSTQSVFSVNDFDWDRKVLAYDGSRTSLLSPLTSAMCPTRKQWEQREIPPLTVIRVLGVTQQGNRGDVDVAVGLWPERVAAGVITLEVPWPSRLSTEPRWESREHWQRTCASGLITDWLQARMPVPLTEPVQTE